MVPTGNGCSVVFDVGWAKNVEEWFSMNVHEYACDERAQEDFLDSVGWIRWKVSNRKIIVWFWLAEGIVFWVPLFLFHRWTVRRKQIGFEVIIDGFSEGKFSPSWIIK